MANVTISKFSDGTNTGYIASQAYFECSTAAATAAKVATSPDSVGFSNTSLSRGTTVFVKFTNENTADSPTLQIGTSTAKSISGSATWSAGSVVSFTYDGTNWIQGSGDSSGGDGPVIVTADISSNPQLFSNLRDIIMGSDPQVVEVVWNDTLSTDMVTALESGAAIKVANIISGSQQGIFRVLYDASVYCRIDFDIQTIVPQTYSGQQFYQLLGIVQSGTFNFAGPAVASVTILYSASNNTILRIGFGLININDVWYSTFTRSTSGSYYLSTAHGGTGLMDNSGSWYLSTVLHPHFEVTYNGSTFNCYYMGPLPGTVSSVSAALACDEVKYALKQPVPVYDTSGLQAFAGLANITEIGNSTGLQIIFADALTFHSMVINGIQGVLAYDNTQSHPPLYLDSIGVNIPWYLETSINSAKILQNAVGDVSIGSTTQPVYWTGSEFSAATPTAGCLTFSSDSSFTLAVGDATKHWNGTLEYSTDGFNWTIWDGTTTLSSVNNVLYLRGTGNNYITGPGTTTSDSRYFVFTNATNLVCKGNIENLLDYQSVTQGIHPTMGERCFMRLFYGCTSLVEPPELPATTLSDRCYNNMFNGCTALTRTPLLPAVDLAVFCYTGLFKSCTSLVAASFSELPARNVPSTAYAQMFWGCTSLVKAPDILADTLDHQSCYGMFEYCSALKKAPKILANTMAEASCAGMFQHCSALEEASALPATILAKDCYQGMYNDCDSLKSIPALPAVTLSENCYGNMFQHSAAIKLSTTQTGEYQIQYRIPSEGTGVTATDALNVMFTDTGGTFSSTPTINTTYWLSTSNSIVYPEGKGYVSVDGDTVRGDITLAAPANNNSPALIFQRGVLNDNYNDWRIQDRGGFLRFDQRGNGSTTWSEIASINTTGTITSAAFSGSGASLTSLNASNISSGTLADGRLPSTVEKVANKVTSITSSSTDTEYPSAKAVYDLVSSSSNDVPVMLVTANYTYDGGGHYTFTGYSVTAPTVSELYNYTQTSGNRTINFNFVDRGEFGDLDGVGACTGDISYFNYDTPPTAVTIFAHLPQGGVNASDFLIYLTNDASTTTVTKTVYSSVTSISSSSTDTQYPTAKAVYDLFASITDADSISY